MAGAVAVDSVRLGVTQAATQDAELRPDVDPEVAMDLVFGPAMYQLVARHEPLNAAAADEIVEMAVHGLAC